MPQNTDGHSLEEVVSLEEMKKRVGSIAHDLNNHLTAVMGYSDILRMKLEGQETLHEYAVMASESSQTMSELTQELLTLSGRNRQKSNQD